MHDARNDYAPLIGGDLFIRKKKKREGGGEEGGERSPRGAVRAEVNKIPKEGRGRKEYGVTSSRRKLALPCDLLSFLAGAGCRHHQRREPCSLNNISYHRLLQSEKKKEGGKGGGKNCRKAISPAPTYLISCATT